MPQATQETKLLGISLETADCCSGTEKLKGQIGNSNSTVTFSKSKK